MKNLEEIKKLIDNWDGMGAAKPNDLSIKNAELAIKYFEERKLRVYDIDADVLGGVAIWARASKNNKYWISCMNNGKNTICEDRDNTLTIRELKL